MWPVKADTGLVSKSSVKFSPKKWLSVWLWSQNVLIQILTLLFTSFVTWSDLHNLPVPGFPYK